MAMLVDEDSRLSKALELHPDVLEYIVSLNPHDFTRLRNPLMRKLMPPRITLRRVATIADVDIAEMLVQIHRIAGSPLSDAELSALRERSPSSEIHSSLTSGTPASRAPASGQELPDWAMTANPVVVDLLESDERLDADPMLPINRALNSNPVGTVVLIKHKWEPQPLYDIWDGIGVQHFATQMSDNEWWIVVRKTRAKTGRAV